MFLDCKKHPCNEDVEEGDVDDDQDDHDDETYQMMMMRCVNPVARATMKRVTSPSLTMEVPIPSPSPSWDPMPTTSSDDESVNEDNLMSEEFGKDAPLVRRGLQKLWRPWRWMNIPHFLHSRP